MTRLGIEPRFPGPLGEHSTHLANERKKNKPYLVTFHESILIGPCVCVCVCVCIYIYIYIIYIYILFAVVRI